MYSYTSQTLPDSLLLWRLSDCGLTSSFTFMQLLIHITVGWNPFIMKPCNCDTGRRKGKLTLRVEEVLVSSNRSEFFYSPWFRTLTPDHTCMFWELLLPASSRLFPPTFLSFTCLRSPDTTNKDTLGCTNENWHLSLLPFSFLAQLLLCVDEVVGLLVSESYRNGLPNFWRCVRKSVR